MPFKPGNEARVKGDLAYRAALFILFIGKGNYPVREKENKLVFKCHWDHLGMIDNYLTRQQKVTLTLCLKVNIYVSAGYYVTKQYHNKHTCKYFTFYNGVL